MLKGLTPDKLNQTVLELANLVADPDHADARYNAYLRFMARLRDYSVRNLLLIRFAE